MTNISVENCSLNFSLYGAHTRSLRRTVINRLGGKNQNNAADKVQTVRALNDVSFSLRTGDRLGLIGHNGSGKSTILKVLSRIYVQTKGTVEINGSVSSLLSAGVGMQPDSTGIENIRLRGLMMGWDERKTAAVIKDIEEFTELNEFLNLPVKIYSAGMNVRLAFALATAVSPEILLIDEVVGAGDASFINKAQRRLDELIHSAHILVIATHAGDIISRFCNKVMWLDRGSIRGYGDPDTVLAAYAAACAGTDNPVGVELG